MTRVETGAPESLLMGTSVPTVTLADRFSMTIPGDWTVLPLDPNPTTRDKRIAGLVNREFGKDDKNATLRRQKIVRLRRAAADATQNGGFFGAFHGRFIDDVPLAASVVVSMMPQLRGPDHEVLPNPEMIAAALAKGTDKNDVLEHSVVELIVGQAARIRLRGGSGVHGEDGREVVGESVHFYVPLSEVDKTLVFVFSTPLLPLADAYVELFDLMAVTGRWIQTQAAEPSP